jgi:release factor glutamine methyltransferase
LGIALKKRLPLLSVVLADISPEALVLAEENAKINHVAVACVQGDLFAPFAGKTADFIVCNPPYISEDEYAALEADVKDYEPKKALVSGKSGLEFYERLADELPYFLSTPGKVWLELGCAQGESLKGLFSSRAWTMSRLEKDWAGLDRFFFLETE